MTPAELAGKPFQCAKCGGSELEKETDILDVWFDSGVSFAGVLEARGELEFPADLYLEGSDQHRGWFHSSLLAAIGTRGRAPYRKVLTHGFVVDGTGKKMSKSLGNVIYPEEVIRERGAEILRVWVAAEDYREDIRISKEILARVTEAYRKIRNTCRFLLGNLFDFDPDREMLPREELEELDQYLMARLQEVIGRIRRAYENFEFHVVYHTLYQFSTVDLSAVYLDVLKDRLYILGPNAKVRRSAQTVIYRILDTLTRLMAPIFSFTAEEIWSHLSRENKEISVHLALIPEADDQWMDAALMERWERFINLRWAVNRHLEQARAKKVIGHALDAHIKLGVPEKEFAVLGSYHQALEELFMVSSLVIDKTWGGEALSGEEFPGWEVEISRAKGDKCQRCWRWDPSVGQAVKAPELCTRCAGIMKAFRESS
jgi:isoleucyl-tRNA synthetase